MKCSATSSGLTPFEGLDRARGAREGAGQAAASATDFCAPSLARISAGEGQSMALSGIAWATLCGLLFVAGAILFAMTGARRRVLDLALKQAERTEAGGGTQPVRAAA